MNLRSDHGGCNSLGDPPFAAEVRFLGCRMLRIMCFMAPAYHAELQYCAHSDALQLNAYHYGTTGLLGGE